MYVFQLKYTVAEPGQNWMLSIAKGMYFLFRKQQNVLHQNYYWALRGHGSWISIYLCMQCLSPLTLWVRTLISRCVLDTTLCDEVCQWLDSLMACILWWNLNFSFKSYGKERLYIQILYECWRWAYHALVVKLFIVYYNTIVSWLSRDRKPINQ
jgi:hypothetical protein